jgi:hypothetical protein
MRARGLRKRVREKEAWMMKGLCIVGNTAEGHEHRVSQRVQSVVHQPYESLTLFWRLIIYSKQQVPVQ